MNKNKIEIKIELPSGLRAQLVLSPRSYKQNFKEFKKKYNINQDDAVKLKNIIQATLKQIARNKQGQKYYTPVKNQIKQLQEEHNQDSPRFPKFYNDQQIQTDYTNNGVDLKKQNNLQYKKQQDIEGELLEEDQIISMQDLKSYKRAFSPRSSNIEENSYMQTIQTAQGLKNYRCEEDDLPEPVIPPLKYQQFQDSHKQYSPNYANQKKSALHNHKKTESQTFKKHYSKPQAKSPTSSPSSPSLVKEKKGNGRDIIKLDRLYYQGTDSFKSKKNQQIDRKQMMDYMEVQKYDMNNRLKRTTKNFFYRLNQQSTAAWEYRTSKSKDKSLSEQQTIETNKKQKKVSLQKAFKGSLWSSRCRCEAHQYTKKLQKEEKDKLKEEERIKNRVKQDRLISNKIQQGRYKSRSCEKCNPKIQSPVVKKVSPYKGNKGKQQKSKKSYISNILQQAYQQRCKQVLNFNNL